MKATSGIPAGSFVKSFAPIGAGGGVVLFDQSADGATMIHGADVQSGGYIRKTGDAQWSSMFSPTTLLSAEYDPLPATPAASDGFRGLAGSRIAPSDKNYIYSLWGSLLFKSTDGGVSQRRTSFGVVSAWSNSGTARNNNPLIDVHPTDPLKILVGSTHYAADTTKSGAFYSNDGGATAGIKISGLPSAINKGSQPDRYYVAFDPGDTTKAYVHVGGVGLYPITIASGVMSAGTLISGSPTRCGHLICTPAGVVYIASGGDDGNGSSPDLYKRTRAGVVTNITTGVGQVGVSTVAVDPLDANRIVACCGNGEFMLTFNGGTSWEFFSYYGAANLLIGSGDIAWLSNTGTNQHIFPIMIKFDSVVANKLWVAHGTGVSYCNVPTTAGGTITLHMFSKGNEEKVAASFLSVVGKPNPILGNWDYSYWRMADLKRWNNVGILPVAGQLSIASDMAVARDDSNFIVGFTAQETAANCYSIDGGRTWPLLPNQTEHPYGTGCGAVSNKTNIITIGTNNGLSLYTKNGGTTWNHLQVVPGVDVPTMINAEYIMRKICDADHQRAGVFALVVPAITPGSVTRTDGGLWVTLDGGDSWTKKIAGVIGASLSGFTGDTRMFYRQKLRYIPGFSGELLHTCHDDLGPDWLHHLTNDGASIVRLGSTVTDVSDFDFGPVLAGQTRPMVSFWGKVSGVLGLYISYDWFATAPVLVTRFPLDNLSTSLPFVGMDRNPGKIRIFVGGIGWVYFDLVDAATGT